jgi:hypothetical protein
MVLSRIPILCWQNTMRTTTCILLLCGALAGCAEMGFPFPEPVAGPRYFFPAQTVVRVPGGAGEITFDYARTNGSDFPYAIAAADRECRPDSKRAYIASVSMRSRDRGRVTFVCL